jgi:hypothetical protein
MWNDALAVDFFPDGSLRDIYVHGTTIGDWQNLVNFVAASYPPVEFRVADQVVSATPILSDASFSGGSARVDISFSIGAIRVVGLFFTSEEIELSFQPADISGTAQVKDLLSFISGVARTLQKGVTITLENERENPIFVAQADGDVSYEPANRP